MLNSTHESDVELSMDDEDDVQSTIKPAANEATQTTDGQPEENKVHEKALQIWLLSKNHRSYEQRATLRSRLIRNLLKEGLTPRWALRKDYEPRPQYVETTTAMLALIKCHAFEIATQARDDLNAKATEEQIRADEYLNIVQSIYVKEGTPADFFKAEARIVEIIGKYRIQERKKLDAAGLKDKDGFPTDDDAWAKTFFDATPPGTSKRRRSRSNPRSTSREIKNKQTNPGQRSSSPQPSSSTAAGNQPPVPTRAPKGKAGPMSHVKGNSNRPNPDQIATSSTSYQYNDHEDYRSTRGRGRGRGRARGRGRGQSHQARPYAGVKRTELTHEDRALFEKMKEFMKNSK